MEQNIIEEKRNKLNLEIRSLLEVIKFIDGKEIDYPDYITNSMNENEFLEQQIQIVSSGKERLLEVFK